MSRSFCRSCGEDGFKLSTEKQRAYMYRKLSPKKISHVGPASTCSTSLNTRNRRNLLGHFVENGLRHIDSPEKQIEVYLKQLEASDWLSHQFLPATRAAFSLTESDF
jgi:hypothetical protein